jgi:hypothetical protein
MVGMPMILALRSATTSAISTLYNPNYVDVFRTTLIQNAEGQWEMVKFCEDAGKVLDSDVEFENPSTRGVITILTKNDVVPEAMGFPEQEREETPRAPDEDMVVEQQMQEAAVASPAVEEKLDEVVVEPFDVASVTVRHRVDCQKQFSFFEGSLWVSPPVNFWFKSECYHRVVNHLQKQELEAAKEATNVGGRGHHREPRVQPAANRPSDEEVAKHVTHTPYQGWSEHCIAHGARPDRHERTDEARTGKMPTISFDLCYTKPLREGELEADGVSSPWVVMANSQAGQVGCCPVKSKDETKLATCEIMAFTQKIGHHEVCFLTDNVPTTRRILRRLLNARHALGLPTRIITSTVADHSNALAENTVNRVSEGLSWDAHGPVADQAWLENCHPQSFMVMGSTSQYLASQPLATSAWSNSF